MAKAKRKNKFIDSDADGLPDELEKILGINPKKSDSDSDGLCDYEEINVYGTDPLNPDTDGDGMSDGAEVKCGRNPRGPGRLKDLFIPHQGNDFKPQALQPKRLIFYAAGAALIKIILIGAVIILPIEAWLTPDILIEQSWKIIQLTNVIRSNLHLGLLTENAQLDQAAFNKAEDMLLNQYFAHSGPDNKSLSDWLEAVKYSYALAGENLAMGFSGPEEVLNGWTRSQTHYQNIVDPDFTQIGVGVAAGLFNNIDTTLVAQYFAAPAVAPALAKPAAAESIEAVIKPEAGPPVKTPVKSTEQTLGQEVTKPEALQASEVKTPAPEPKPVDTAPLIQAAANPAEAPAINLAKSKLYIDQPSGQKQKIVRAEIYLSSNIVKAKIAFNNYIINLSPADEAGKWSGQAIVFNQGQEQIFNPVVLPVITAEDQAGNIVTADLKWEEISPAATTKLQQYYFIKQHQPAYVKLMFDISSTYYKIILLITVIALALNIFIQVKKQHPHIILSTLGLIGLLIALIVI